MDLEVNKTYYFTTLQIKFNINRLVVKRLQQK